MKKRRTLIIALLLVAAIVLGVGYAALSRELVISSTAQLAPDDGDFKVLFIEANTENTELATASLTGDHSTANYTVIGLSQPTEDVTLTFKVQNQTPDVNAKLTAVSLTDGMLYLGEGTENPYSPVSDYFTKVVTITHDQTPTKTYTYAPSAPIPADFILAPNETATVTVTVTLNKTIREKTTLMGASVVLDFEDPLN